jgi:glycosyltransferase involved in cell wall biosynthesis
VNVCILIGSADISGGSYVIFEHALYLQSQGWNVILVPLEPVSSAAASWHPGLAQLKFKTYEEIVGIRFDLAIATWWRTVYELHRIDAQHYCYFVQSIESWFYPDEDVAVRNLANSTYLFDLPVITEAKWIKDHLKSRFDVDARIVRNGCNKAVYAPTGPAIAPPISGKLRILVEGPIGVDFKNTARTIALLRRTEADEIWLLTNSVIDSYPGVARVFSRVPAYYCAQIYRSCDVLVKLSYIEGMFGPPLEAFHCGGTAVVYDVTGHDEYIVDRKNALVIPTGDESAAAAAVNELKRRPELLASLKQGALRTAENWPDWKDVSPQFEQELGALATGEPHQTRDRIRAVTQEVFHQYVRVENALAAAKRFSVSNLVARLPSIPALGLTRRFSWATNAVTAVRTRWILEKRRPASRSKI